MCAHCLGCVGGGGGSEWKWKTGWQWARNLNKNAAEREICPTMTFIRVKEEGEKKQLLNRAARKLMTTLLVYPFCTSRANIARPIQNAGTCFVVLALWKRDETVAAVLWKLKKIQSTREAWTLPAAVAGAESVISLPAWFWVMTGISHLICLIFVHNFSILSWPRVLALTHSSSFTKDSEWELSKTACVIMRSSPSSPSSPLALFTPTLLFPSSIHPSPWKGWGMHGCIPGLMKLILQECSPMWLLERHRQKTKGCLFKWGATKDHWGVSMCWGEDKKRKKKKRSGTRGGERSAEVDRAVKSQSRLGDGDISRLTVTRPQRTRGCGGAAKPSAHLLPLWGQRSAALWFPEAQQRGWRHLARWIWAVSRWTKTKKQICMTNQSKDKVVEPKCHSTWWGPIREAHM